MPMPGPISCHAARSRGVPAASRGYHVSGTETTRPSRSATMRRSRVTRTSVAVGRSTAAEVPHAMPFESGPHAARPALRPCATQRQNTHGCTRHARGPARTWPPCAPGRRGRAPARRGRSRRRTGGTDRSAEPWGSPDDCASFRRDLG